MPTDLHILLAIAAIFAFAGWIKGVIGLGLPTIATGLMGLVLLPAQAAAIVVLPSLLTNVWQMASGGHFAALLKRLWPMLASIVAATVATAGMITGGNVKLTVAALGAALMAYAIHALWGRRISTPPRFERLIGIASGLATGIISGTTGVFVVPSVPFLQTMNLDKNEMVQAIGITAFTSAFALTLGLGVHGGLKSEAIVPALVATLAGLAGMGLGQIRRAGLSLHVFRRWVLIGLLALGASMVARGLM